MAAECEARVGLKTGVCRQFPAKASEQRRLKFLDSVRANRRDITSQLRRIAVAAIQADPAADVDVSSLSSDACGKTSKTGKNKKMGSGSSEKFRRKERARYAQVLSIPEYLYAVDVIPSDLSENWIAMCRPEGARCLLVTYNGITVTRKKNGSVLHRFQSKIPDGSTQTREKNGFCMLDCVFQESTQKYIVLDVICWKGYPMCEAEAELRFFWMRSKLEESGFPNISTRFSFDFVKIINSLTPDSIGAIYGGDDLGYLQDGVLFWHKEAPFVEGVNPLCLFWKDEHCCPYSSLDDCFSTDGRLKLVLQISSEDNGIRTWEGVQLGVYHQDENVMVVNEDDVKYLPPIHPEKLVKFTVSGFNISESGDVSAVDLRYEGPASRSRMFPDHLSKALSLFLEKVGMNVSFGDISATVSKRQIALE
eukprot:TRINITY_DN5245_c0_g1_i1.p1 TRINITY_DN5245_c0_g1~~TRINITY_DN5245_c0_g1_i1.p1  ORF type:complete len:421 (+),score=102.72 TRINITY_DN5245_c0_g1_i1:1-1263(+)